MIKNKIKVSVSATKNGLKILNFYDPDTRQLGIEFITKASTSINPKGKEGLAHFTEHLLARQSKNFPTQLKQAIALEELGAGMGATTSHFWTAYYVNGGVVDADRLSYILSDMIVNPHVTKTSLSSEKSIIEKEIARDKANESKFAYDNLMKIFAKGSPLMHSNLGYEETLNKLTKQDVLDYVGKNYLANNSLVVFWGGLTDKKAESLSEKYFSTIKKGQWKDPRFNFSRKQKKIVEYRDSHELNFRLAYRLKKDIDLTDIAAITKRILVNGWTSRIASRMRVKESLVYSWGGSADTETETAHLFLTFNTSKNHYKKSIEVFSDELSKFVKFGTNKKELEHVKNKMIKPFAWSMERAGNYASWYVNQYLYYPDKVITPEQYIKDIKAIKPEDVNKFVKEFLTPENWYLSVVGPVKDKDIEFEI